MIEFFWYSCPHCNAFEPKLDAWVKKLPAGRGRSGACRWPSAMTSCRSSACSTRWKPWARSTSLHGKVFQAIHAERQPINREDCILAWAGKQGLDTAKFKELYNSFSVSSKARRATQLQDAFKVQGVPAHRHRRPLLHRRRPWPATWTVPCRSPTT